MILLQDREQSGLGPGRQCLRADLSGRRAAGTGGRPHRRAERGDGRIRAHRATSFGEVENALAAETALREREAILTAAIRDNERALELAQIQYRVGKVDLRVVEQRQLSLYGARSTRLHVQAEQLAQRVNLYLALGGGFDLPSLEPVAAR